MSEVFVLKFTKGDQLSFAEAFKQIPTDDLNRKERAVVVKVGIFKSSSSVRIGSLYCSFGIRLLCASRLVTLITDNISLTSTDRAFSINFPHPVYF